ncbi:MAG: serine protein kinase RIO [Candidatus Thalassarchaeum betae]|uniref:non-specific serine/threonine protein kinase n=1 Tax=Candidatus Thalassarchaeum betae TaxID=2599289 RepID=A0A2V3HTW8_9ARCH|nr:MAG: serine protein kinase RIO [Candidatus Thalassoarchaea betae]PXF26769.1 MAG: serine protein kinase RIO [Euryarchaeota archaeon]HIM13063.1 serine protein kinase RIO [Candidatus Poseidoniales archaeon]HIM93306.1 serine protein kinase RIO [Candidatus Poseidoniales archaeon]
MSDEPDEQPDIDALMKGEKKYEWLSDPRFKRLFTDIEDGLQGVLGRGKFEWVDRRVFDQVFDSSTLLAVHKLMQKGGIDTIDYPIARGKEAHVFHASTNHGPVAVKIFHTSNAVFKGLAKYIDGDPRFSGLSRRHRELVNIWVRKEFRNLKRMRKHGLRVPEPLDSLKNVLVMSYLGDDKGASPRLKDITIDEPYEVFEELLDFVAVNWQSCGLVHADFSEYNVLWYDGEPWVIDVGQAVTHQHPNAEEFLVRDVTRLVEWINRQGYGAELAESLARVLDDPVPTLPPLSGGD